MLYNQPYRDLIQNANTWLVTVVATAHRDAAERARTNERRRCAVSAPRSWRENAPSLPRTNESRDDDDAVTQCVAIAVRTETTTTTVDAPTRTRRDRDDGDAEEGNHDDVHVVRL